MGMKPTVWGFILTIFWSRDNLNRCDGKSIHDLDVLVPYITHHGPKHRTHREVRDCQHVKYGNVTHSKHKAFESNVSLPLVHSQHQLKEIGEYYYNKRTVTLLLQTVNDPRRTFSVLEPKEDGGCSGNGTRATVRDSAKQKNCILASNAGFFNTTSGQCLGNIYSDGSFVQDSGGVMNAHFGVTDDGYLYVGYVSELDLLTQHFRQLVGGVLWVVREGEVYVDESIKIECSDTEETGTLQRFADVQSARTAVGHDKDGRILIAEFDGKTGQIGVNLYEMAKILIDLGFVNAINLDGGGSATLLLNLTLVSRPSDRCEDKIFNCEREVSTILCVHERECVPRDCSGHGECRDGDCECSGFWSGEKCDTLSCPGECSGHGTCTSGGCECERGYKGDNCSTPCDEGEYGSNCSERCCCQNKARCDPVSGRCDCPPGFSGQYCQSVCPYGYYGSNCRSLCDCGSFCLCDPVTGSCNSSLHSHSNLESGTDLHNDYQLAGTCIAREIIQAEKLVPDEADQYRLCVTSSVVLGVVSAISIVLNIILLSSYLNTRRQRRYDDHSSEDLKKRIRKFVFHGPDNEESESDSGESGETTTVFHKVQRDKS